MMKARIPQRGDIVTLEFNSSSGHEQAGFRPALVVSHGTFNARTGFVFVCPITSRQKGYPFEVEISATEIRGVVLTDQLKSIDFRARNCKVVGKSDDHSLNEALRKIKLILA